MYVLKFTVWHKFRRRSDRKDEGAARRFELLYSLSYILCERILERHPDDVDRARVQNFGILAWLCRKHYLFLEESKKNKIRPFQEAVWREILYFVGILDLWRDNPDDILPSDNPNRINRPVPSRSDRATAAI